MYRILISGYYGFGNTGDEAILLSILQTLKNHIRDVELVVLSAKPKETEAIYNVKSIYRFNFTNIIRQILKSDMVISGGGSLLQDITSFRTIPYYLSIIYLAKRFGKKAVLYSNGIGPVNYSFNKYLIKKVLNEVDLITLRDHASKKELENLGVTKPPIYVTADSVFALTPVLDDKRIDEILLKEGINLKKPLIGISLRRWRNDETFFKEIAGALDYIKQKYDVELIFIPMQREEDLKAGEKLQNYLNGSISVIINRYSVLEWLGIINRMKLLIGMRLHSLIFAALNKVPMIGIIYDPKVESFLNIVGQPSGGQVSNLRKDKLINLIEKALLEEEKVDNHVIVELREKALANIKYLLNIINQDKRR